jgi:hypothetical protein
MSAQTNVPPPEQASSAGGAWEHRPGSPADRLPPPNHPSDALREAMTKLSEVREFAAYYVAVRMDAVKATVRNVGIYAALGLIGLVAGAAVIATAAVLLLVGVSGAFAALLGGNQWLGAIITAVLVFALLAAGVVIGLKMLTRSFKSSTVKKYEERQRRQRQQFQGRDVRSEATAAQHIAGQAE